MGRRLSKEEIQRANKPVKRCSDLLTIRETQLKATVRYRFTLTTMPIKNERYIVKSIDEDVEKSGP